MRHVFAKSFHLCLRNDKICTKYAEIHIKSCYIIVEFQELIFGIDFTVVTTCVKSCSKKLERLCTKEVCITFIMDSEAILC